MNVGGPDGEIVFRHDKGEVDDETEGARFPPAQYAPSPARALLSSDEPSPRSRVLYGIAAFA